jgi:hypothetical protein
LTINRFVPQGVVQRVVFDPLAMKDSGYDWTRPLLKRRASGYSYNPATKSYMNADFLDMSLPHAAGSLSSTVRDLHLWDRALHTGKVLVKASLEKMFTPGKRNYAYGWSVEKGAGRTRIGHGGGINGYSSMIQRYPDQDAVVIVLSNVENGDAGGVAGKLSAVLFGEKAELPWERREITLDPKILERYRGTYQLPPFKMTVSVEGGKLMVQAEGQPKVEGFAESETKFFLRVVEAAFEFTLGEDGRATELILRQGGMELRGKRVEP